MSLKQNSPLSATFSRNGLGSGNVLRIFIAALLLAGFLTMFSFNIMRSRQEATLVFALEDGKIDRMFQGRVIEGMTIFQALLASSRAGQITFKYYQNPKDEIIITELDGYTKLHDKELVFYLNGIKINSGNINTIFIKGGDRIEIRPE